MYNDIEAELIGNIGMLLKDGTRAQFNIVAINYLPDGQVRYVTDSEGFHIPWGAIVYFKKFDSENIEMEPANG